MSGYTFCILFCLAMYAAFLVYGWKTASRPPRRPLSRPDARSMRRIDAEVTGLRASYPAGRGRRGGREDPRPKLLRDNGGRTPVPTQTTPAAPVRHGVQLDPSRDGRRPLNRRGGTR